MKLDSLLAKSGTFICLIAAIIILIITLRNNKASLYKLSFEILPAMKKIKYWFGCYYLISKILSSMSDLASGSWLSSSLIRSCASSQVLVLAYFFKSTKELVVKGRSFSTIFKCHPKSLTYHYFTKALFLVYHLLKMWDEVFETY